MIWLLRHGEAEDDASDDASRRLTEDGERQAQAVGAALAVLGVRLDACLTSPKRRSRDTARIACEPFGIEPEETDALAGGDFDPADLAAGRAEVLLVGHEPDLSRALQASTGARTEMKKGGLAAILIASPFLFGFSDEDEPTAVFIGGGVLHLLISIATRYRRDKEPKRGTPKREQRAIDSGGSADEERPSRAPEGIRDDEIPEFEPPPRSR